VGERAAFEVGEGPLDHCVLTVHRLGLVDHQRVLHPRAGDRVDDDARVALGLAGGELVDTDHLGHRPRGQRDAHQGVEHAHHEGVDLAGRSQTRASSVTLGRA
jgi:hypothetical protein